MGVEGRTTGNHALTMRPNMLFVVIRILFDQFRDNRWISTYKNMHITVDVTQQNKRNKNK